MKSGSLALIAAAAVSLAAVPAFAQTVVTGLQADLSATPEHFHGPCPGVITFHGKVRVEGHYAPGATAEIGYQFTRSDGAMSENKYIETHHPGVYDITETWTLGGGPLQHFDGWEKFKAWPTSDAQNKTGTKWSNEAHFTLTCAPR
jgi:hypothetical protein